MGLPFFRESGAGPGVVCFHSNAASSSQWRGLMDMLAGEFRLLALDSHGAGQGPAWPVDRTLSLDDEVALAEPVLRAAGERCALVGHSYGGAVALRVALAHPQRVSALVLYEPTLFSLVESRVPPPNDVDGIRDAVARAGAALDAGDEDAAARHFIDFWMAPGTWDQTPPARKPAIMASVRNVRGWGQALLGDPTPVERFATLDMPKLYMVGGRSPLAARAVARALQPVLRHTEWEQFEALGHMGPLTHSDAVNPRIASFLRAHARC